MKSKQGEKTGGTEKTGLGVGWGGVEKPKDNAGRGEGRRKESGKMPG